MKKNDRPEISDDDSEEDKKQNVNNNNKKGEEKTELQLLKEKAAKKNSSSEDEEDESEYDPYKIPLRFLSVFTPQELDMTKHLYQDLDEDKSGSIDSTELAKLFEQMEEEVTPEDIKRMVDEVDDDGSGEIEYAEFLALLASFKKDGSKFSKFTSMMDDLHSTPMAELIRQARKRNLTIDYKIVRRVQATSMTAEMFVAECTMSGEWVERIDGKLVRSVGDRIYQGIDKSTRNAKMAAATAALTKLKADLPGIIYEPGVIPMKWFNWLESNMFAGCDPEELLQTLVKKGFVPAKNHHLMQLISMHVSFKALKEEQKGAHLDDQKRYIPPEWLDWAELNMKRGVRGDVVLGTLVKAGFRPERNPHLAHLLRENRGGGNSDKIKPKILDFWEATETNDIPEVRRYLKGGQDPNERRYFKGAKVTAMEVAMQHRHLDIVILMVQCGYDIEIRDYCGRTALLNACIYGSLAIVEFLVAQKADFHARDRYGDFGVHLAAQYGHLDICDWLLDWQEERLRRYLSGGDVTADTRLTFTKHLEQLYETMMTERLKSHQTRQFPLEWVIDAALRFRREVDMKPLVTVIEGAAETRAREKAGLPDPPWGTKVPIHTYVEHIDPRDTVRLSPILKERVQDVIDEYGPPNKTVTWVHMDGHEEEVSTPLKKPEFCFIIKTAIEQSHVNLLNTCGRTPLFKCVDPLRLLLKRGHVDCANNLLNEHQADTRVLDQKKVSVEDIIRGIHYRKEKTDENDEDADKSSSEDEDSEEDGAVVTSPLPTRNDAGHDSGSEIETDSESEDDDIFGPKGREHKVHASLKFMNKWSDKVWFPLRNKAEHLRSCKAWAEYTSVGNDFTFFFHKREASTQIHTPLVVEQVQKELLGWALLREQSDLVQTDTHGWIEFIDKNATGEPFYYYPQMRKSQWSRPVTFEPLEDSKEGLSIAAEKERQKLLDEKTKLGWARLSAMNKEEWAEFRRDSTKLRKIGQLDEYRHDESGGLFYYSEDAEESVWEKPKEFLALEKRKYSWHLINHMSRARWQDLLDRSETIRQIDEYHEKREERHGLIFYYNEDMDVCDWAKPQAVLQEEQNRFGNEVGGETIDDWERVARSSTSLRTLAAWEEFRNEAHGVIFYVSTRGYGGSWMKPDKFLRAEKRHHGFELLATQEFEDYEKLRKRSKRLRSVDPWEEWRDEVTGVVYYFHKHEENTQWKKPHTIVKAEQQRNLWTRRYELSSEIEKIGPWEVRRDNNSKTEEEGMWWTNTETCVVLSERPAEMDEEDRRMRRKHALTRTQTDEEWKQMHAEADIMRAVGPWEELHHHPTGSLFYFNSDTDRYHWEKPEELLLAEKTKRGTDLVAKERPEDWRRLRTESEVLRTVGDWSELRNEETGIVFYFNSTSVQSLWHRPDAIKELEQKKRGWWMVNKQTREQWDQMIGGSTLLREFEAMQEWRHRETLAIFYNDIVTETTSWDKPAILVKHDRDSLAPEMGGWSDREWGLVRMRSEKMRRVNAWHELRDGATSVIFYYNDDTGHYQLNKSEPVLENEKRKRAWTLVRKQKHGDWAEMRSHSSVLRNVLHYQELRDDLTQAVFYYDTKSPVGQCSWKKPDELWEYEKVERGRQIVKNQPPEDWLDLRLRAQEIRRIKRWFEFREPDTGMTFYFNDDTEESSWEKPIEIIDYDAISRGWQRILNESKDVEETHLDGKWEEIIEDRFGATFYKNTKELRCAKLPFCQWAKPQDIIDVEDAERLKIKLNRPIALCEEFISDVTNWTRILQRSKKIRNKPYLNNGWVEYFDDYSGIHFFHKEDQLGQNNPYSDSIELKQNSLDGGGSGFKGIGQASSIAEVQVSFVKPHAFRKYDRKMFFWATLIRRSIKLRTFTQKGWTEYVDTRLNDYFYVHEKDELRSWKKPSEILKDDEDEAWEVIIADVEQVLGHEQRGPSGWKVMRHKLSKQQVYHHKHLGCTWIKPQAVIDDSRALQRKKKELEDLERRSKTLERDKADAKRIGGYLAHAKKIKESIVLASENLLDDNFESDQEDDDEDMTQEEKHLLKLKRRRERLALVLEEDDRLRRNKKKKKNMTRRKRRLGERLAHSKQLLSEIHLFVEEATERKNLGFQICTWGCGEWLLMAEQKHHVANTCPKRMLPCNLKCGLFLRAEFWDWAGTRETHEENECVKRKVMCPQGCKKAVVFEDLEVHCQTQCAKRRIPPLHCRLDCGMVWIGGMDRYKAMLQEREEHEKEECQERIVQCDWVNIKKDNMRCMAEVKAKDLRAHRQEHVKTFGISYFRVHGGHSYKVPRKTKELKFQLWGGGGGGGHLFGSNGGGGTGGGGGYIEGILKVTPGETLDIVVGAGGDGGVHGTLIPNKNSLAEAKYDMGIAYGGEPGGGNGYASNGAWAAGAGGGFTAIFRNGPWGKETILVAGGGGGGGSRNGCPGGGFEGGQTADDPRNGKGGTQLEGGEGGHFPLNENWSWDGDENNIIGKEGGQWQGGHGSIFGAGGGGGFFGGGGGGSTPGIVGGGGGGSSYASDAIKHVVTLIGEVDQPGGMNRKPPTAVGLGEWDPIAGFAGQGGPANEKMVERGRDGCVIIRTPGFYQLD